MNFEPIIIITISIVLIWTIQSFLRKKKDTDNLKKLEIARNEGLTEPPSLHPVIDPDLCIGSGSCISACPEGDVLGLIKGKAALINPTHCIGHGACFAACPVEAITLVFGTKKRGVDIPHVKPDFETNVPGIFIAGELGGMGLIRNAVEQGRQAVDSVRKLKSTGTPLDLVIVGAGPAGFSATLACKQFQLRSITVEQEALGGRVAHFPRGKIVMTQPAKLPLVGEIKFGEIGKEKLLVFMKDTEAKTGIKIQYNERMESVEKIDRGFIVKTSQGSYQTRAVLLTLGRGGTPRKLGVPGEELPKVVYRLIDPAQYQNQHILVVGGGDAALEAAISIAMESRSTVTLSYRGEAFSRVKEKNRQKLNELDSTGKIKIILGSNVKEIKTDSVTLESGGKISDLKNDTVIVCAGGILPTDFLKGLGVEIDTKFGSK